MIGSLIYLANTRPDICFAVNTLCQFPTDPRHVHLVAAKHVLRYLKVTVEYGLKYDANKKINLHGPVDSYWVGNATYRKIFRVAALVWDLTCSPSLAGSNLAWH